MAYIYESHMADLFTTDHELSYKERYCEQCGDSDLFLGKANTADEAWALLKPQTAIHDCSDCEIDDCNECEFYEQCCGYNYGYIARFISEEFAETIKNPIRIVLLMTHPDYPNKVYVKFKKDKDGIVHPELPFAYTLDEDITFHANSLCFMADKYVEKSFKYLDNRTINGVKYIYFVAKAEDDIDKCHCYDNVWVGFTGVDTLSELDKYHFNVIAEKSSNQ